MQSTFLESDFFSEKRILLFGINRIQSYPTIDHVKRIDAMRDQFILAGIDKICFISVCDFLLFEPMMAKLAPNTKSVQLTDQRDITMLQELLGRKGSLRFLQEYWQFAAVINNHKVELYKDHPFTMKLGPDTRVNIYESVSPEIVLQWLTDKSV
jgi:peroxiredoxin